MKYQSALPNYNLNNQRVILRADLNVPINNGIIGDDFRLHALLPTIDCILKKNGSITLLTHIGRPQKQDPALSTRILIPWFKERNYPVSWAADIESAQQLVCLVVVDELFLCRIKAKSYTKPGSNICKVSQSC